jgi:glycosyltransferase involved in cell wall biosynthesis
MWVRIENSAMKPLMHVAYRSWQRDAYAYAQELSKTIEFDLVHVITYVGFRFPGHYWRLPLPLVWGPIGGLENTPWRYLPAFGVGGGMMFAGRNILNSLHRLLLREPRRAFRKAEGGIIAATSSIKDEIKKHYGVDSVVRCEIGAVGGPSKGRVNARAGSEPLRIVWSGLHISRKALPLLLEALAELPSQVRWQLAVLGSGPLTDKWKGLAVSKQIDDKITWTGRVDRASAIETMSRAHVMVVTSLYDLTSSVLVEALSVGLPVICPNHYGFSDAIDDSCGLRVGVGSLKEIRIGVRDSIASLYNDEQMRQQLARNAYVRAGQFDWKHVGHLVSSLYEVKVGQQIES